MSLDIALESNAPPREEVCYCPECSHEHVRTVTPGPVHATSITSNVYQMAEAAGLADALWSPGDCHPPIERAGQLEPVLEKALARLRADPVGFRTLEAAKGYDGTYDQFVVWLDWLLYWCHASPSARLRVESNRRW